MAEGVVDTIFALATAQGKSGVAVVRVSGDDAFAICQNLVGDIPKPRVASLRRLVGSDGSVLDEALVLVFPKGQSFTGEPTVELQLHGSVAIVRAVLTELSSLGARLAEPGEFTRRALENGRLDLAQVEALADLIESETELQRRQALRLFEGSLGTAVERWRTGLVRAAALLEVSIDFADEEIPEDVTPEVLDLLKNVIGALEKQLAGFQAAESLRIGFQVAIVGAPNVGKSTLLNAIAGRDAAIVSEIAGTTRDVIEVRMDLNGLPVTFLDTAGLRNTEDAIESIGIERALRSARDADLRVFLGPSSGLAQEIFVEGDLIVSAKADLTGDPGGISGLTGQGVSRLLDLVQSRLAEKSSQAGLITRERHRVALLEALTFLRDAESKLQSGSFFFDIVAEDLRSGIRRLESLVGRVDVEAILGEIFSSFCLGK